MVLKNALGNTLKHFARIFPGISEYQNKEDLRSQDKIVREHLAEMLKKNSKNLDKLKIRLIEAKKMEFLTKVELITKKISKLSDMTKHASYGYSPVFSLEIVNEEKLKQMFEYDISLAAEIRKLDSAIEILVDQPNSFLDNSSFNEIEFQLNRIETLINGRKKYS